MPKFLITRVYKHTESLLIEADNKHHALELAQDEEFEIHHDDWLYSEDVKCAQAQEKD